eukprot:9376925-Lingulodinium_polyedra.AAC.1
MPRRWCFTPCHPSFGRVPIAADTGLYAWRRNCWGYPRAKFSAARPTATSAKCRARARRRPW